jgi:hypothetical protein
MKKEYRFALIILVGVLAIVLSYYYLQRLQVIAEFTSALAIYISSVTAVYTAIAKPNPNKSKKQKIYGQLKKSVTNIISTLEDRSYHRFLLEPWSDIQVDDRYHLVSEKLRNKLDDFSEKIEEYMSAINKIDFKILERITQDVANEIFEKDQSTAGRVHLSILLFRKRGNPLNRSVAIRDGLIKNLTIEEAIDCERKKENLSKKEVKHTELELQYYGESTKDIQMINNFWDRCLKRLESIPEYKFIVEKNDVLAEEAKEIRKELIKRIEKAVE